MWESLKMVMMIGGTLDVIFEPDRKQTPYSNRRRLDSAIDEILGDELSPIVNTASIR